MKYSVLILLLFTLSVRSEYKKLDDYGLVLFHLILDYVESNSTQSADDVVSFINSPQASTVFSDANSSGYSRYQLLFNTYQQSFNLTPDGSAIVSGLHDTIAKENMFNNAVYYGTFASMGTMVPLLMYIIRQAYVYFRFDNPTLNFYRTHDSIYLRTTTGSSYLPLASSDPLTTNPTNNTSLLVPEPFIPNIPTGM